MSTFFELRKQHAYALNKAESILKTAEDAGRELTANEQMDIDTSMAAVKQLEPQIRHIQSKNTIQSMMVNGTLIMDNGRRNTNVSEKLLTADYQNAFFEYVSSNGQRAGAALYEGSGSAGGYVVPLTVDSQVVVLAPTDTGVREIATVVPTVMDIRLPRATTISTAAAQSEGDG